MDVPCAACDCSSALVLQLLQPAGGAGGEQIERTDRVHAPAAGGGDLSGDVLADAEDLGQLRRRTPDQIVGGQQPQRDDTHADFLAPAEEFEDLRAAGTVPLAREQPRFLGPAAISVQDDADVARNGRGIQRAGDPALIGAVQQLAYVHEPQR